MRSVRPTHSKRWRAASVASRGGVSESPPPPRTRKWWPRLPARLLHVRACAWVLCRGSTRRGRPHSSGPTESASPNAVAQSDDDPVNISRLCLIWEGGAFPSAVQEEAGCLSGTGLHCGYRKLAPCREESIPRRRAAHLKRRDAASGCGPRDRARRERARESAASAVVCREVRREATGCRRRSTRSSIHKARC